MDADDYTQPVEAVAREERLHVRPLPLAAQDRRELFDEWCRLNPEALRAIELTAISIDGHGKPVSAKYLIEKQRYEGGAPLVGVPFLDGAGVEHKYAINNSDTALIARWLLGRHPGMRVALRRSMFDEGEGGSQ